MNNKYENSDYKELIGKYLANETSTEENSLLEKWVKEDPANKKIFIEYKQGWILSNINRPAEEIELEKEWDQLAAGLFAEENDQYSIKPADRSKKQFRILKIAAAIVVVLSLGYLLYHLAFKPDISQMIALQDIEAIELPDGTEVTLNINSLLTYPEKFKKEKREVELTGDAFFDVVTDLESPFSIKTEDITITVLGTSFYVNAHKENPFVEVIVETGKVALEALSHNLIILEAGEKGVFYKDNQELTKVENRDPNFISWKTRNLVFDNISLGDVVSKINDTYHINIQIENEAVRTCMLTATFEDQPIESILEILQETFDLEVEMRDGEIFISGGACE